MWIRYLIYALFLLSGSTGLVYEVLWHRELTLVFGSTIYAATTILTVFFTGLALGAFLIGRAMDRGIHPLATYGILEVAIGLFGICSPLLFNGIDRVYLLLLPHVDTGLIGLTAVRFVLAYLALLLPTTLMGATLPVLVKLVSEADSAVSSNAGRLYGLNTSGAALGAFLAAIVLIPLVGGVHESLYLTGAVNLLIGGTALLLLRRHGFVPAASPKREHQHTSIQKWVLAFFCVAGFLSMAYQVAWIRVLFQVTGSTIYAFGLILSIFIVGVGLGSELATRFLGRIRSAIAALIAVEVAASLYTLFLANYYDHLPVLFTRLATEYGLTEFGGYFVIKMIIISIVMFFPTLMFGAAFPFVAAVYARSTSSSGGDVGSVYALNTVGGVLGSFLGGFVLLPRFGAQNTIIAMSVGGLVLSVALTFLLAGRTLRVAVASVCLGSVALFALVHEAWDVRLMDSAPYITHYESAEAQLDYQDNAGLMYYQEGVNVNVSVYGHREAKQININGKPMATVMLTDVANQYLLGHIPMLLHPAPKQSVVIGLGAGMTFSALVRHGQPADCVEISPEVVPGTRLFARQNHSVLDQPNAQLIFNDGRNYLKTTRKKYDVITEDPLDPFFMGSGYLYNVEHFQNAQRALNPGGVMCQYLPLYQVGLEEAKIIIKTFHAVFPYVTAWFSYNDMLLIGSEEPVRIDLEELKRRVVQPNIAEDLRAIGIDNAYDFLSNFLFDETSIPEITRGVPLNTDNYPIIEYMTPRALFRNTVKENVSYFLTEREPDARECLQLIAAEQRPDAEEVLTKYYRAKTSIIAAHLNSLDGDYRQMLEDIARAIEVARPHSFGTYYIADAYSQVGRMLLVQGERERAMGFLEKALGYRDDEIEMMNLYAEELLRDGKRKRALEWFRRSLEVEPAQTKARYYLAQTFRNRSEYDEARDMIDGGLRVEPNDVDLLVEKAYLEVVVGNRTTGMELIDRALRLEPDNRRALGLKERGFR
ncbi:MAG: spermidine synthase [Gemmatimonadota bacterium]|nr:MAG: spermidine synthase [Gemmatimonadota bacterium]